MSRKSGFGGFGYGFGKGTPKLREIFRSQRLHEAELKPEIQAIVKKYAEIISKTYPSVDEVEHQLKAFAHELEAAEGEDPKELDQGGPPFGSMKK